MDRGVVLTELDRFGLQELELDEPGPGEARIRLEATGVCHSDLHVVRTGFNHPLPVLLGHEGAGVVEAVVRQLAAELDLACALAGVPVAREADRALVT